MDDGNSCPVGDETVTIPVAVPEASTRTAETAIIRHANKVRVQILFITACQVWDWEVPVRPVDVRDSGHSMSEATALLHVTKVGVLEVSNDLMDLVPRPFPALVEACGANLAAHNYRIHPITPAEHVLSTPLRYVFCLEVTRCERKIHPIRLAVSAAARIKFWLETLQWLLESSA
jgi:hypothetical protein